MTNIEEGDAVGSRNSRRSLEEAKAELWYWSGRRGIQMKGVSLLLCAMLGLGQLFQIFPDIFYTRMSLS